MSTFNVCFSTGRSPLSRLIRWVTRSQASHALITFYDETLDKVFVMEANGRGFMLVPWSKWRQSHKLVARYELDIPEKEQLQALREVSKMLGAQYDYISLFGHLWMRFKKRCTNPLDDPTKLVCSEAVALLLYKTGNALLTIFENYTAFGPQDIIDVAQRIKEFVLIEDSRGLVSVVAEKQLHD